MLRRISFYAVWVYLLLVVLVALAIYGFGDWTWWGTVLLFGPRWVWLVPLPAAAIAAAAAARWSSWMALAGSAVIGCFAILGYVVPWSKPFVRPIERPLRILTCNLGGSYVDYQRLSDLLSSDIADVVAFQEADPAVESVLPAGWSRVGVWANLIASRYPLKRVRTIERETLPRGFPRPVCIEVALETPQGVIRFASVHLASPREGLTRLLDSRTLLAPRRRGLLNQQIQWRRDEHGAVSRELLAAGPPPLIVAGDFNTPVESTIYRECWSSLRNAFSTAGFGTGPTVVVSQGGIDLGARIDHVLVPRDWRVVRATVLSSIGSDHRPVLAEVGPSGG